MIHTFKIRGKEVKAVLRQVFTDCVLVKDGENKVYENDHFHFVVGHGGLDGSLSGRFLAQENSIFLVCHPAQVNKRYGNKFTIYGDWNTATLVLFDNGNLQVLEVIA
jgi:hypothetical protein